MTEKLGKAPEDEGQQKEYRITRAETLKQARKQIIFIKQMYYAKGQTRISEHIGG